MRHELVEFYNAIVNNSSNLDLTEKESIAIAKIIEMFSKRDSMITDI